MMDDRRTDGPRLSPRLAAVGSLVSAGCRLADVGSDHALLPIRLLIDRRVRWAVATERSPARLESACRAAERFAVRALDLRAGDGLDPLTRGDGIGVLVLAGIGGRSTRRILDPDRLAALGIRRLVLQPQTCVAEVREHLDRFGWVPVDETVVADRGRFYSVLAAETDGPRSAWEHPTLRREDVWAAGPVLLRTAPSEAVAAWRSEHARLAGAGRGPDDPEVGRAARILSALEGVIRGRDG